MSEMSGETSSEETRRQATRTPVYRKSRQRVAQVLAAAKELVVEQDPSTLSITEIAKRAGVPKGTIYQYFADRDAIFQHLAEEDMAEMSEHLFDEVLNLPDPTVSSVIRTAFYAFTDSYRARPAFIAAYLRGSRNTGMMRFSAQSNTVIGKLLREYLIEGGLATDELTEEMAVFMVSCADHALQAAFNLADEPDMTYIDAMADMLCTYATRFETPRS